MPPTMFDLARAEANRSDQSPAHATAQPMGNSMVGSLVPDKSDLLGRAVKGILYSAGLFGLLALGYRRFRPATQRVADDIRVVGRKSITPRAQLLIVEVENKRLLLSMTNENLSLVTELSPSSWDQMLRQEDVMLAEEMIQSEELNSSYAQGGR